MTANVGSIGDLAEAGEAVRPRAVLGLIILLVLTILSYLDRTIILLLVEPIKADLGIDDVRFSLLTGLSFALCYGVSGLAFGWLADRVSRRWIVAGGVAAWSVATALCGLATSFAGLFAARMGVGVGEAALSPVGYAIVGDMFPRRRVALVVGVLAAGTSAGAAIAYGLGGLLIEWANGVGGLFGLRPWQTVMVAVALPGLLLAPFVFVIPREADRSRRMPGERAGGYAIWLRANAAHLVPTVLGAALVFALLYGITAWMPALLFRRFGLSPTEVGGAMGLALGLPGMAGFIAGGAVVDRLATSRLHHPHLRYMTVAIAIVGVIGIAAFAFAATNTAMLVLLGAMALLSPVTGPVMAYLRLHTPEAYRGRTIALFLLVYNLFGMTVGPSAVAIVSRVAFGGDLGGGLAVLSAACGGLGTLLFLIAARHEPAEASR